MQFSLTSVHEAHGHILAHSLSTPGGRLQKGRKLTQADCALLARCGFDTIWTAALAADDVSEDEAATLLATALAGSNIRAGTASSGRCNLYAEKNGLVSVDPGALDQLNLCTDAITVATRLPYARVASGQMLATIKIIPFAVDQSLLAQAQPLALAAQLQVRAFQTLSASLILTRVDGMKQSLFDKAISVTRNRLHHVGANLTHCCVVDHDITPLAAEIRNARGDLILILGGSAISDRADIVPAAIDACGGTVLRLGMPVDPGNLLCLARHADGRPILGLPGCARSAKRNGLDWVLERLAAGYSLTSDDIARMGVGGLLDELADRGKLRDAPAPAADQKKPAIGALILAAGRSLRMAADMDGQNKLLLDDGNGPIIRHVAQMFAAQDLAGVIVVTGRDAALISAAVAPLATIYNPDFEQGLSTSIKTGIACLPQSWDGVLIALGDMPAVKPQTIRQLCAAAADPACDAVIPVYHGRQGHPVLWKRAAFPLLTQAEGDMGGKAQLAALGERVRKLEVDDAGVLLDIDTAQAWENYVSARS